MRQWPALYRAERKGGLKKVIFPFPRLEATHTASGTKQYCAIEHLGGLLCSEGDPI